MLYSSRRLSFSAHFALASLSTHDYISTAIRACEYFTNGLSCFMLCICKYSINELKFSTFSYGFTKHAEPSCGFSVTESALLRRLFSPWANDSNRFSEIHWPIRCDSYFDRCAPKSISKIVEVPFPYGRPSGTSSANDERPVFGYES